MWSVIAVIGHHCWVVSHAYWQMLLLRVGFRTNCRWSSIIYLFIFSVGEWRATQGFSVTKKQNWQPVLLMLKLCFLVPRNRNVTFISNTQTRTYTHTHADYSVSVSARCETEMSLEASHWNTLAAPVMFFEKLFIYQLGEKTFEIYWGSQWCHHLTWVACTCIFFWIK